MEPQRRLVFTSTTVCTYFGKVVDILTVVDRLPFVFSRIYERAVDPRPLFASGALSVRRTIVDTRGTSLPCYSMTQRGGR